HMPIMFNTLLSASGIALSDVRLLRHKDNRSEKGRSPYELWRDNPSQFELYQSTQSIDNESRLRGKYWASFLGTPARETLFVGLYRVENKNLLNRDMPMPQMEGVDKAGSCHIYDLMLEE